MGVSAKRARDLGHQGSPNLDHEVSVPDIAVKVAERACDVIRQICQAREVAIVRGSVSPGHIHLLVSAPRLLSPAKLVLCSA